MQFSTTNSHFSLVEFVCDYWVPSMAYNSWVLCFSRGRETSSSTCLVILVSPSGPLITWSPLGTSHLKAPKTESPSLWEVSSTPSLHQSYKALLAYLILSDIRQYTYRVRCKLAGAALWETLMLNACVYIYIWLSLGNCIKHLYFWFFIHGVDAELNTTHMVVCPFTLIELSVFFSLTITLYIWRGSYWCVEIGSQGKNLTSLLWCCCLVFLLWAQSAQSQHGFQGSTCLITRAPALWWTTATTSTSSSSCPARATWALAHQDRPSTSPARVR